MQKLMTAALCSLTLVLACWIPELPAAPPEGFEAIFNGRDLTGWEGKPLDWKVEDGCLTGTTDGTLKQNRFLVWRGGKLKNFELRVQVKVSPGGNSGINYRSTERPDLGEFVVTGYQCDVVANRADYNGMLYEERGRRILARTGEKVVIDRDGQPWVIGELPQKEFKAGEWHEYRVLVRGNHHQHWIDNHPTVDVIDLDEKGRKLDGVLAVQVHVGPAMKIQYKDFFLKRLPDHLPLVAPDQAKIPATARKVVPQGKDKPKKPQTTAQVPLVIPIPETLRSAFQLDPHYQKCVLLRGFPVVGSVRVSDFALHEAAFLIDSLLAGRNDLRQALVASRVRFGVLAAEEMTTDLPEYRNLKPALFWNKRARGLGATPRNPLVSCGEENLLNYPGDPYAGENILVHEFAHALQGVALRTVDPTFEGRLTAAYDEALRQGLWKVTYAASNRAEYWAEGVQAWFDCNQRRDPQHNGVMTRTQLEKYDPRLAQLLAEVFKDNDWRYVPLAKRKGSGHLAGLEAARVPRFNWPADVLEWNRVNVGNGVLRGKAGSSEIVLTTQARMAGAFASLTWGGKEFLDSADHGRLLQSAANFDLGRKFIPETFNPTEAGSRADGAGNRTSSYLHRFEARGTSLTSITRMAFWLAPGEKTPEGDAALNSASLSDHWLTRRVQIGWKDLPHVLEYEVTFTMPEGEKHTFAQFEALTGYMPTEFGTFWTFDAKTGAVQPLTAGPGEQHHPLIFATRSGSHALGVFSPDQPSPGFAEAGYGRFQFEREQVHKWNCVFRIRDPQGVKPDRYTFRVFLAVGTFEDVKRSLTALTAAK